MAERLAELEERKNEALHAGSPAAVERHHAKGKLTARERIDYLLDEGSFQELDMLARHRAHGMGLEDNRPVHRRRRHRLRHDRRAPGLHLQPGLHRLRRCAGRGVRREDPQGHGPGRLDRRAHDRAQRRGGRPHPGGRRLAALLRGHLPPQRGRLGGHPPDQRDPRALRRRRRLLAGHDRLHLHGAGHLAHVHHRTRRGEDGDRRGRDARGAGRRHEPRHQVGGGHVRRRPTRRPASTTCGTCCRSCRRTTSRSRRSSCRATTPTAR